MSWHWFALIPSILALILLYVLLDPFHRRSRKALRMRYDLMHREHLAACFRAVTDGEYKWLMRMGWQPEGEAIRRTYHHHGYTEGVSLDPDVIYLADGTEVGKGELFPMPALDAAPGGRAPKGPAGASRQANYRVAPDYSLLSAEVRKQRAYLEEQIAAASVPSAAVSPDTIVHPKEYGAHFDHPGDIYCDLCTPEHVAWVKEHGRHRDECICKECKAKRYELMSDR